MKLSYVALLLSSADAFPSSLSPASLFTRDGTLTKRANEAGIGIELETQGIKFENADHKSMQASPDDIKRIKGQTVSVIGSDLAKASTDEWKLTAEHSGLEGIVGVGNLQAEWIVLGEKVKLGKGNAARIGKEITSFLVGRLDDVPEM